MQTTKAYLSIKEAAEILDVHYTTVMKLVGCGALPAFKVGRQWRIKESDLEAIGRIEKAGPDTWEQEEKQ
jgi:excisionase family DNA binding protein